MPIETAQSSHASLILVTGAAGAIGSIGRNLTEMLLAKGHKVRALVRREDGRAEALRLTRGCVVTTARPVGSMPTAFVDAADKARHLRLDSTRDRCEIEFICRGILSSRPTCWPPAAER